MKRTLYTKQQQQFLKAVSHKVEQFFAIQPEVGGHEFDHARRVAAYARQIAAAEQARSPWLCEMAGLLHDIGRVTEFFSKHGKTKSHHEWSYLMLREWFREEHLFDRLTDAEKRELLYVVRYHWNNEADKYDTAWILRDADKLDALGTVGLKRAADFYGNDEKLWNIGLRFTHEMTMWIRTPTTKRIMKERHLLEPITRYYQKFLRERIEPVEL